ALYPGEVDLRIDQGRVLPLGIGALAAEAGKSRDPDGGQPARNDSVGGWQAGDVVEVSVSDREVIFAGLGAIEAEAGIEDLAGADEPGITEGYLLIENADVAVGLAVQRDGNRRMVDPGFFAVADTQKGGVGGIDLPIEPEIPLVGVIRKRGLDGVVVGCKTGARHAGERERTAGACAAGQELGAEQSLELRHDLLREWIELRERNRSKVRHGVEGVSGPRGRVLHRRNQIAGQFVLGGQSEHTERLENLAEAFVVEKEEELVLNNGPAEI